MKCLRATQEIKANRLPNGWNESPKRLQQKDLDAGWVIKNDINHYCYKNSICIDAKYGFTNRFVITPANILDDYLWADSVYTEEYFKQQISAAAAERNCIRSQIRAQVEYVFGYFDTSMGGKFTRKIRLIRNKAWLSLKNLTFNFLRYLHHSTNSLVSIELSFNIAKTVNLFSLLREIL